MMDFQYIASVSLILSFVSISLVLIQLYDNIAQRRIDAEIRVSDINRQLITLGFSHPELFMALHGEEIDPVLERHYLQLWFNQFDLIFTYQVRGMFGRELRESLERDIRYFLEPLNAQRHWRDFGKYYTPAFRDFVDSLFPSADKAQA